MFNDTYVTLQEADEYFSSRYGAESWDELESEQKEKALVTATRRIDLLPFIGRKKSVSQALQFPRDIFDGIPQQVKAAVCEEALSIINGTDTDAGAIQSVKLGDASVTYSKPTKASWDDLLSGYLKVGFDIDNAKFREVY